MEASSPGQVSEDTDNVQALHAAIDAGNVERVAELLLTRDYSAETRTRALDSVCATVPDNTDSYEHDRKKRVFWERVGTLLSGNTEEFKRDVSDSRRKHAVEQAVERADYRDLVDYILPQCSDSEMDTVMTRCLSRGLWETAYLGIRSDDFHLDEDVLDDSYGDMFRDSISDMLNYSATLYWFEHVHGLYVRVRASLYRNRVRETVVKAVEEASRTAEEPYFVRYVLPHCKNQQVNTVLTNLVARDMWQSVSKLLEKRDWEKHFQWAVKESVRNASDEDLARCSLGLFEPKHVGAFLLPWLAEFGRLSLTSWFVYLVMYSAIELWIWPFWMYDNDGDKREEKEIILKIKQEKRFWVMMTSLIIKSQACSPASLFRKLMKLRQKRVAIWSHKYFRSRHTKEECNTLFTAVAAILCSFACSSGEHVLQVVAECEGSEELPVGLVKLEVLKCILHETERHLSLATPRRDLGNAALMICNALLSILTTNLPWTTKLIWIILDNHTWDILKSTCLWHCGEPTRRHMFKLAVKHYQWKIVKQWADHTLYDDQRWWALDEAYKEKQWDVMLRLADHGLAELELTKVTNRLIRSADWRILLRMLDRGVDIAEIKATLLKTLSENKQKERPSPDGLEKALQQIMSLKDELDSLKFERHGMRALKNRKWRRVFYFAQRSRAGPSYKLRALKAAIKSKVWHVVIPLIRLGIDTAKHDSLFTGMMKRRQWGVCSALLDLGVSLQVCLDALSELMEMNQWTLVARVMEFNVGDAVRQQVMQRAMERREGSVVWRCISTMDHYRLSVEERQTLFQQAFSHGDWQTIKPLVETKDDTGIKHRDIAMLAAIEQHQWDVVDYCQLYGADINVKDELGETPLNRASNANFEDEEENDHSDYGWDDDTDDSDNHRDWSDDTGDGSRFDESVVDWKDDWEIDPHTKWEAVEALVVRDADPNILDRDGYSVLNNAIDADEMETVKLLIEYLGDIHQTAKCEFGGPSTPLQLLIEQRYSKVIQHTLMWCPDLWRGVTEDGETTLHALCDGYDEHCENSLYYHVRRGVNPFALTNRGESALFYAVNRTNDAQKMVAECIQLGFSTHQPHLTDIFTDQGQYAEGCWFEPQSGYIKCGIFTVHPNSYVVLVVQ